MVNYYIYAKDFSGSTDGVNYYHNNGMNTLDEFKRDVEKMKTEQLVAGEAPEESKIIYLHWGDKCYEVDEDITKISYANLVSGNMGTDPETIIHWIQQNCGSLGKDNKIKLLYIITDGLIGSNSVGKCFKLNENMFYETVVFHAFNEDLYQIDLSVAASFLKCYCIIYRNCEVFDNVNISKQFEYEQINVDNFLIQRDNLKSYIKLKFINKFKHDAIALQEIDKLKKLRNRLFVELSSKSPMSDTNLNTKDRNIFLGEFVNTDWYKNLNTPNYDLKVEIEKSISTLINYIVSDTKSYSFDALKFETKFDNSVEEEPIVDVNFTMQQEIEFPDIIMDDDKGIPVIILTEINLLDKIIFHKTKESVEVTPASFNKFKSAMECPLFLMNDPDIKESIGYFYTLNVYKQFLVNAIKTEPRTRRPFHGGLVVTNTDEFDNYNDYILSATYFNFKKINYNTGLFYFVLWKNCENKEWMDKNIVEQFKKYIMRRISTKICKIGLSSLPLDPQINTLLPTALWYCVELSSRIFKEDPQNFMHERLRMYCSVAHHMIEILKYLKYDLDLELINKRVDLFRHVNILKRIRTRGEKIYFILEKIFKNINGFLIHDIEKPFNVNKLNYLKVNHKCMLPDSLIEENVDLNEYVHLMHFTDNLSMSKDAEYRLVICEKTFRPYFAVDKDKSFYVELIKITKKAVINYDDAGKINISYDASDAIEFSKILSLYNLFINCVKDHNKYPTFTEYVEYISQKKKYYGDLVTIFPPNVYTGAEKIYSNYQNIMNKIDVNKFIEVSKAYVNRAERIKAEGRMHFNNDKEIDEFISSEEVKVNLKKKNLKRQISKRPFFHSLKREKSISDK